MKIKAWKGGRTERMYARIIPQAKQKLLARIALEGFTSFADWLEAEAERSPTQHALDGGESAALKAESTPEVLSTSQALPKPTRRK